MIICFMLFMFFNAFKSLYVGADTFSYYEGFCNYYHISWSEQWTNFVDRYFGSGGNFDEGFVLYCKICQLFTRNYIVFQLFSSVLYFIPLGIIMMRYVTDFRQQIFAFVLYITLIYASGVIFSRQQMATVLLLWEFILILDNKYFKAILLNVLALTLHMSSAVFFVVPLVSYFAKDKIKFIHLVSFFVVPLSIIFSSQLIQYASGVLENDRYGSYGDFYAGGGVTFAILMELLTLLCYIGIKKESIKENDLIANLYIMAPFATITAPLIMQDGVFFRLCKYFFLYLIILVPIAIDSLFGKDKSKDKGSTIAYFTSIAILVVYSAMSIIDYTFIWDIPYNPYIH